MYAILGATGKVGGATARALRQRGLPVRAIVRDASTDKAKALADAGCTIVVADIRDTPALTAALTGVDAALVLCPLNRASADTLVDTAEIRDALATALTQARPPHIVALSDMGAHHATGTGVATIFHNLEQRLRPLPIPTTFLRSAEHMENWTGLLRSAVQTGTYRTYHPITRALPTVWSADVAALAADLLTGPPAPLNVPRVIHAEGPRRYTPVEMATTASALADRPIQCYEVPQEQWLPNLISAGMSETHARLVNDMYAAHITEKIEVEPGCEVRHGTTTLAQAYAALLGHGPVVTPRVRGSFK